jgi:hypothetical protein
MGFQYDDLEVLGCLSYPVGWPSAWPIDHLRTYKWVNCELNCIFTHLYKLSSYLHMWAFSKAHFSKLSLLLLRWCLASLYAYFDWDGSLMLVVACLTCLFISCYVLAHGYLLVVLYWSPCEDSLFFCKSWHHDVYNCLNTCLYDLWSTLILDLMHSISFFSQFVFDEFIAKGGEYGHKVGWTLANWVVEKRNKINVYLRGELALRVLGGVWFRGGSWVLWAFCVFKLFLALLCHFGLVCRLSYLLLVLRLFLLLDGILELFVGLWSSSCASWGLGFKLQTLYFLLSMDSSKWRLRNQVVSSLVWLWWVIDMPRFKFKF